PGPPGGARPRRARQAGRGRQARGAGRALRAGGRADHPPRARTEDQRPAGVLGRFRRPPIRKGKLGKPTEFGYVAHIAEITENTRRGARGFILPGATAPGNPAENTLLTATATELERLDIRPRELVGDGGFQTAPTLAALPVHSTVYPGEVARAD
ncbi:MAG: hypothetical protein M3433_06225, partial [Actinomycetota bacterium]|nr:hypothetical protein [Actinomycetota bacterium]